MARSRILSRRFGQKVIHHEEDGKVYFQTLSDAEPIIEFAKAARDIQGRRIADSALGTRVAIIPKTDLDRAFIEGWANDPSAWRKWYAENPLYRTSDLKSI